MANEPDEAWLEEVKPLLVAIREAHEQAEKHANDWIDQCKIAGDKLQELKTKCKAKRVKWKAFCKDKANGLPAYETVCRHIKVSVNWSKIQARRDELSSMSMTGALRLVSEKGSRSNDGKAVPVLPKDLVPFKPVIETIVEEKSIRGDAAAIVQLLQMFGISDEDLTRVLKEQKALQDKTEKENKKRLDDYNKQKKALKEMKKTLPKKKRTKAAQSVPAS